MKQAALTLAALGILSTPVIAQDSAPLVRPKNDRVKVTVRKPGQPDVKTRDERRNSVAPDGVVALVNQHRLTRAQLDYFVERRMQGLGGWSLIGDMGQMIILDKNLKPDRAMAQDADLKASHDELRDSTRRQVESEALQGWVEQRMLADEARRQGITISTDSFQRQLDQAKRDLGIPEEELYRYLAGFKITQADFEAEVYDAMLIDELVDRFVSANSPEQEVKAFYDARKDLFRQPERYRFVHFVVAMQGNESKDELRTRRALADKVRKRLDKEPDAAKVISEEVDAAANMFGQADTGLLAPENLSLPRATADALRKLKPRETSSVLVDEHTDDTGRRYTRSFQVVRLIERKPAGVMPYAEAAPFIRRQLGAGARPELVAILNESRQHLVITNSRAIPVDLIPSKDQLLKAQASAKPVTLRRERPASPPPMSEETTEADEAGGG